jgi:hypothetical protein
MLPREAPLRVPWIRPTDPDPKNDYKNPVTSGGASASSLDPSHSTGGRLRSRDPIDSGSGSGSKMMTMLPREAPLGEFPGSVPLYGRQAAVNCFPGPLDPIESGSNPDPDPDKKKDYKCYLGRRLGEFPGSVPLNGRQAAVHGSQVLQAAQVTSNLRVARLNPTTHKVTLCCGRLAENSAT